jgi:hypothetical protein
MKLTGSASSATALAMPYSRMLGLLPEFLSLIAEVIMLWKIFFFIVDCLF